MKTAKLLIMAPNPSIALSSPKAGLGTSEEPEGAGVGCGERWVRGTPNQPGVWELSRCLSPSPLAQTQR